MFPLYSHDIQIIYQLYSHDIHMFFSLFVHIFLPEISRWVLHHAQDRAQSFGLWGIAGFIGNCLGPLVAGGVLWLFPGASRAMWRMGRMGGWGLKMAIQRYLRNRWDMLTSTIHKSFFFLFGLYVHVSDIF